MPKKDDDYLWKAVPFEEAAAIVSERGALPREIFDQLLPEFQASAIVITGVEDLSLVRRVRDRIAELPMGEDWDTLKKRIAADIVEYLDDEPAALARAELLLRAHGFAAYSAANWRMLEETADVFPWRKYQTAMDGRVRASHAALNGIILPASSPFWVDHTPPWEFGCRCDVLGMTDDEVQGMLSQDRDRAPEARLIGEPGSALLNGLEGEGRILRRMPTPGGGVAVAEVNVARDPKGFRFRPKDVSLLKDEETIRRVLGDDLMGAFRNWAQDVRVDGLGGSVWDWVTGATRAE